MQFEYGMKLPQMYFCCWTVVRTWMFVLLTSSKTYKWMWYIFWQKEVE